MAAPLLLTWLLCFSLGAPACACTPYSMHSLPTFALLLQVDERSLATASTRLTTWANGRYSCRCDKGSGGWQEWLYRQPSG